PRDRAPEKQDAAGQDDRDQSLAEKPSGRGETRQERKGLPGEPRLAPGQRRSSETERGGEEERQRRVRQVHAGEDESPRRGEVEDPGGESDLGSPSGGGSDHEHEKGSEGKEARREARGPWSGAEEPHGRGVGPVEERRLLEVRDAVQAR